MKLIEILNEHKETINLLELELGKVDKIGELCNKALSNGNKIIFAGNGGSAADSQHLAAEFTGRFVRERKALAALSLTVDTSAMTAIANDYAYDVVFQRQLSALGKEGDVFVGISTSGNSQNIINAVLEAKNLGIKSVVLTGKDGGILKGLADISIIVNSNTTARIQECHILIGHMICEIVDSKFD